MLFRSVEAGGVAQGDACFEQFLCLFGLEDAFEFGELEFVVHAGGEMGGAHLDGMDFDAVGNGFGDEVDQGSGPTGPSRSRRCR